MSKPFDVTTKELVEANPEAWIRLTGLPVGPIELVDTDLATVSTEADKVLRVKSIPPYMAHIELQTTYKPDLPDRTLRYNVIVYYQHGLPVQSIIFLLRQQADGPRMTGRVDYAVAADGSLSFRYRIVRIWELPLETLLNSELALLPLALLTDEAADHLPEVIRSMESRIQQEAGASEAEFLWTSTYLLMGLRFSPEETDELLKGVRDLEDSATYQAVIAKGKVIGRDEGKIIGRAEGEAKGRAEGEVIGRAAEARNWLLLLGRKRFGEPDAATLNALDTFIDIERLEQLGGRLLEVESWSELLA